MAEPDRLAEIRDEIRSLRVEFQAGLQRIHDNYVHKDVHKEMHGGLTQRVADLEASTTWLIRLVLSAVILAVIGGVLVAAPITGS